jgi:hypothetical protein
VAPASGVVREPLKAPQTAVSDAAGSKQNGS